MYDFVIRSAKMRKNHKKNREYCQNLCFRTPLQSVKGYFFML